MEEKVEETHRTLGLGGLHKKKQSKNWYYRCTINGKVIDLSTGTDDIDDAEKIARAKFLPMTQTTQEEVLAGYVAGLFTGALSGAAIGKTIDRRIIQSYKCDNCGYDFAT